MVGKQFVAARQLRVGRMMGSFQIYRMVGQRAVPLELPAPSSHAKGKILDVLTTTANPGSEVFLAKDGAIIERAWGFMPKESHFNEDYSKYGMKEFDGSEALLFIHHLQRDGSLKLTDIKVDFRELEEVEGGR